MSVLFRYIDRIFNRLYSSRYNPIYTSGSIAMGLFVIVFVTGLYLIFFYRLGEPYESVAALSAEPWLGSWIRTLHRYASDLMVISVVFHVMRMISQRKAWGPRVLAWLTGIGLVVLMLISGWTGYVMVWDAQAQDLAVAGAKILDSLGLFPDSIVRSFSGVEGAQASFFFLNLFLHVAIPLGMVFGVWAHTFRMARADWFPERRILYVMSVILVVVSVIWAAPLGVKADLLQRPSGYPKDWFFNFWISWVEWSPLAVFSFFALGGIILAVVPWVLKPKGGANPAYNDPNICVGCSQCVQDCPYEAIQMVSMDVQSKMKTVALVSSELCVSCGLCSASCESMTIGPEGRKAGNQVRSAKAFLASVGGDSNGQTLVVGCLNQSGVLARLGEFCRKELGYQLYPVDCPGTIHSYVYNLLANHFHKVVIVSCPGRNCMNKDGYMLLTERLAGLRPPMWLDDRARKGIQVHQVGDGEESALFKELRNSKDPSYQGQIRRTFLWLTATVASLGIVFFTAWLTRIPATVASEKALLRISVRLVGQSEKDCQTPSPEKASKALAHMRAAEVCTYRFLSYQAKLNIDGKEYLNQVTHPGGFKRDRPIYVNRDIEVEPGRHQILFTMEPLDAKGSSAVNLRLERDVEFYPRRVALIHFSPDEKNAVLKEASP